MQETASSGVGKKDVCRPQTVAASAGVGDDAVYRSVSPPVHLSVNYAWSDPLEKPQYDYARSGSPTRCQLEETLCRLEGAEKGIVTSSGMAALDLVFNLLGPEDLLLAPHDCYGGTHRLLAARSGQHRFRVAFVDQTDPAALAAAFSRNPKMVLIETPSNPLLRITDIRTCVALARSCGATTVADNTFLSPVLQNPLSLGCDLVVHSTTKFINGHSDIIGGVVLARDRQTGEELSWWANCTGVGGASFDSFMTLRGIRTLFARVSAQQDSASFLVKALDGEERVSRVYYPGLDTHPGHDIAQGQQRGSGSMFSVEFSENVDVAAFLRNLKTYTIAESLGGFESLVCLPASMTHAAMTEQALETAGISPRLVRFSTGLEHREDLLYDIRNALDISSSSSGTAGDGLA